MPSVASEPNVIAAHHARNHAKSAGKRTVSKQEGPPFGDLFDAQNQPETARPEMKRADSTSRPSTSSQPRQKGASKEADSPQTPPTEAPGEPRETGELSGEPASEETLPTETGEALSLVTRLIEEITPEAIEETKAPESPQEPATATVAAAPDVAVVVAPQPAPPPVEAAENIDLAAVRVDGDAISTTSTPRLAPVGSEVVGRAGAMSASDETRDSTTTPDAQPVQTGETPPEINSIRKDLQEAKTERPTGESRLASTTPEAAPAEAPETSDDSAVEIVSATTAPEKQDRKLQSTGPASHAEARQRPESDAHPVQPPLDTPAEPAQPHGTRRNPAPAGVPHPSVALSQAGAEQVPDAPHAQIEPVQSASPSIANGAAVTAPPSTGAAIGETAATPTVQPTPAAPSAIPMSGIAVEIAVRAQAGHRQFDIRLDPPELGRIDVRLDVDSSGNVSSRLIVERAETLDLLRREAPQLERALQDAGLKSGDNALQFSLRDQGDGTKGQNESEGARNAVRLLVEDESVSADMARNYLRLLGRPGGIDIRV